MADDRGCGPTHTRVIPAVVSVAAAPRSSTRATPILHALIVTGVGTALAAGCTDRAPPAAFPDPPPPVLARPIGGELRHHELGASPTDGATTSTSEAAAPEAAAREAEAAHDSDSEDAGPPGSAPARDTPPAATSRDTPPGDSEPGRAPGSPAAAKPQPHGPSGG